MPVTFGQVLIAVIVGNLIFSVVGFIICEVFDLDDE